MSLKRKFLIIFIFITIIPIVIITLFTYDRYTKLINEQLSQVTNNVFENALETSNEAIGNIEHIAEVFTFYSESKNSIVDDLKKYSDNTEDFTTYDIFQSNENIKFMCQNLMFSSDYINAIYVFTPTKVTLGYGYGGNIDIHYDYLPYEDEWYQKTVSLKGEMYINGISKKDFLLNADESITFSKALYDVYSHKFLGVLLVDCSPSIFNLESINTLPETTALSIKDMEKDTYLYNSDIDNTFDKNSENTETIYATLKYENLQLCAKVNYEKLYKEFGFTRILIIVIGIVCAIVFIIISFFLSNSLTKPIINLSEKMRKHKGHSLVSNEKYLSRSDEIGILCNEYNTMIGELEDFIKREYQNKLITLDSQMKSLEAQINSHFLYNTLESINSIAEIEEVESISTMSLALGKMFRYSIKTKSELVSISEELSHVNDYISIQKIRFNNNFDYRVEIPDYMKKLKVLKLILQPIVENAVLHGFSNNSKDKKNLITITGQVKDEQILLSVIDNGSGMNSSELAKLKNKLNEESNFTELGHRNEQSIGLKNIHTRLELYYGQTYGLYIESNLSSGTKITIKCPVISRKDNS